MTRTYLRLALCIASLALSAGCGAAVATTPLTAGRLHEVEATVYAEGPCAVGSIAAQNVPRGAETALIDCLYDGIDAQTCLHEVRSGARRSPAKPGGTVMSLSGSSVLVSDCHGDRVYFCGSMCGGQEGCIRYETAETLECAGR